MIEDKNIDRLFQEQLKDMEVTPDPAIWNALEAKLQKKKRRILPIWWFYGGAVASLILGFLLFSDGLEKEEINNINFPVITEQNENNTIENSNKTKEDIVVTSKEETEKAKEKTIDTEKKHQKNTTNRNEDYLITTNKKNSNSSLSKEREEELVKTIVNNSLFTNKVKISKTLVNDKNHNDILVSNSKTAKAANESEEVIVKGASSDNIALHKKDSLTKTKKSPKDFLAEISKNKELKKEEKTKGNKWGVSPVFGILRSNSFTESSALDATLNNNTVSSENTFSYGLNLVYKLNDNWSLKSGVQLQKTAFTTKDIPLVSSATMVANNLENVDFITSGDEIFGMDLNADNGLEADANIEQGNIQQTYGYVEVPFEVKYRFFKSNTIQTSLISGFSSLFLIENSIVGESTSFDGNIGEASNLNSINFSGNLGVDIDFTLSKKLNLNINPMFKTQLNTFSRNSNGFKPYILGVYTGIKYEF